MERVAHNKHPEVVVMFRSGLEGMVSQIHEFEYPWILVSIAIP